MKKYKKPNIAVVFSLIAVMIFGLVSSTLNSKSAVIVNAFTNSRNYFKYDATDGCFDGYYTLPQTNTASTNSIVNYPDDRSSDRVYDGVVKLIGTNNYLGTGFIVDNHIIATAAHCVYDSNFYSEVVEDILVFDSDNTVKAHLTPVEIHIPVAYLTYMDANNGIAAKDYDYALITVEESLPTSRYTYFNLSTCFDNVSVNGNLKVTGFPQFINNTTKNSKTIHKQYTGSGSLIGLTDKKLYHDTDTSGGNSGGPVYIEENLGNNKKSYSVLAIHTNGIDILDSDDTNNNCGTRITTDIMKFYLSNSNIGW